MARLQQISTRNRLLSALNRDDFDLLQPDLEPVALELCQWLIEAGEPIQQVYFPEHGIVSILADTSQGRIEVGLIGPEGMAGLPVVLCFGSSRNQPGGQGGTGSGPSAGRGGLTRGHQHSSGR